MTPTFDCVIGPFAVPGGRGTSPRTGFARIVDESPSPTEAKAFACRRTTEAVLTNTTTATLPTRRFAAFDRSKTPNRAIFIVVRPALFGSIYDRSVATKTQLKLSGNPTLAQLGGAGVTRGGASP